MKLDSLFVRCTGKLSRVWPKKTRDIGLVVWIVSYRTDGKESVNEIQTKLNRDIRGPRSMRSALPTAKQIAAMNVHVSHILPSSKPCAVPNCC